MGGRYAATSTADADAPPSSSCSARPLAGTTNKTMQMPPAYFAEEEEEEVEREVVAKPQPARGGGSRFVPSTAGIRRAIDHPVPSAAADDDEDADEDWL